MSASVPGVIELRSLQVPVDFAVTGLLLMLFCIFFALSCVFTNTLLSEVVSCGGEDFVLVPSGLRLLVTIWWIPGVLGLLGLGHGAVAVIKVVLEELGDIVVDFVSLA